MVMKRDEISFHTIQTDEYSRSLLRAFITTESVVSNVSSRVDPLDELQIPDETTVEEHDVVTEGDILIGRSADVEFGLRGRTVAAGERVTVGGSIEADTDCRLDTWSEVNGSVLVGADAYVGERVTIDGQLLVSGDLDIGDDVEIGEGFEANGWIVVRSPIPVVLFYFIVLSHLLRLDDADAAEEFASALAGDEIEERDPLVIPASASVSDNLWDVDTPATIGDGCRIHGNIRAASIAVGTDTTIFGSLTATDGAIDVGNHTEIVGNVSAPGTVTLDSTATIRGNVEAGDLIVYEGAYVEGKLIATGEMRYVKRRHQDPSGDERPPEEPSIDEDDPARMDPERGSKDRSLSEWSTRNDP